jgi:sugar lactone lactonase YvrE
LLLIGTLEYSCNNLLNENYYQTSDFTDSVFTGGIEGPAADLQGNIYAVNFEREGTIGVSDENGNVKLYIALPKGSTGNGIRINREGNLFVADYTGHNILLINKKKKEIKIHAHDSSMNQPNDIAITGNNILFASDPDWKNSRGKLWRIDANGKTVLLEDSMGTTNGIEVSPGDSLLYVNESIQRNVWVYTLDSAGNIRNKRLLISFPDFGMDGMRCDDKGNLYITRYGKGTVVIVNPQGEIIKEVSLKGKKPTNITFGGKDGKTCFVTMQDRGVIEMFRAENKGRE